MAHALLKLSDKPDFPDLEVSETKEDMLSLLESARKKISLLKKEKNISWPRVMQPFNEAFDQVSRAFGVVRHIESVCDHENWRALYTQLLEQVTDFYNEVFHDKELFQLLQNLQEKEEEKLSQDKAQDLKQTLRAFKLSGVLLNDQDRALFREKEKELSLASSKFSQNVLDATDAFTVPLSGPDALAGLNDDEKALFKTETEGYALKLQFPYYRLIMKSAEDRTLRAKMHHAYHTRASDLFAEGAWDNGPLIDRILNLRSDIAHLLGFSTYAERSLVTKMAKTSEEVFALIDSIVEKARPLAKKEWQELVDFAANDLFLDPLEPWDISFASEKLKEKNYAFSENVVKSYFIVDSVLKGLFDLIYHLYGVEFIPEKRPLWHEEVRFYRLEKKGVSLGGLYMDLYARERKRGGAWMDEYCGRWKTETGLQLPLAYLICNFTPPIEGQEKAHLSHDEIVTLFHEMGHSLHHLLTEVDEVGVAGISGVEWDAVEAPSQFMENFAWEYDVLQTLSRGVNGGLPKTLFDKMRAAKNFQVGLTILRQMQFAAFDMAIHRQKTKSCDWRKSWQEVQKKIAIFSHAPYERFAQSFEHIFSGGYAAGYYSYVWAEILAADIYALFKQGGIEKRRENGEKFLAEFLSRGSTRSAMASFIAFRGRQPKIDAFFESLNPGENQSPHRRESLWL